jgi:hypothetical protein
MGKRDGKKKRKADVIVPFKHQKSTDSSAVHEHRDSSALSAVASTFERANAGGGSSVDCDIPATRTFTSPPFYYHATIFGF